MKRYLIYIPILIAVAFILAWNYHHHVFMYGDARILDWSLGVAVFIVKPMVITALLLYACYVIGRWLVQDWMVACALGMGFMAAFMWFLTVVGLLNQWIVLVVVVTIVLVGLGRYPIWKFPPIIKSTPYSGNSKLWMREWVRHANDWSTTDKIILAVILAWVGRTCLLSFNPSIGFDAIHAHLWQIQNMIAAGRYLFNPHYTNIALAHSLTTVQMLCFVGDPGSTLQYGCGLLSAGFLYRIGSWLGNRTTGLLAALIWLATPITYFCMTQWFAGGVMVMFLMAGASIIARSYEWKVNTQPWWGSREVGLLLGFACAAKITALPVALLLIPLAGCYWWRVTLWMIAAASPWYIINVIQYGNPFFPFMDQYFGWMSWGMNEDAGSLYSRPVLPENWFAWDNGLMNWWYGNSPVGQGGEMSIAGPLQIALTLPLLFVPIRKWSKPVIVLIGIVVLLYAYFGLVEGIFHPRYMLPVFALHGLLAAWGITTLLEDKSDA